MRAVSSNEDADFEARVKAMKEFMGSERFKYTTRPYKAVGWERVACTCHANWSCTPHTKQMFRNSKVSGSETWLWTTVVTMVTVPQVEDVVKLQGTFPMYFNGAKVSEKLYKMLREHQVRMMQRLDFSGSISDAIPSSSNDVHLLLSCWPPVFSWLNRTAIPYFILRRFCCCLPFIPCCAETCMDMFRQSAAKAKGTCSHTFGALDTVQARSLHWERSADSFLHRDSAVLGRSPRWPSTWPLCTSADGSAPPLHQPPTSPAQMWQTTLMTLCPTRPVSNSTALLWKDLNSGKRHTRLHNGRSW